MFFDFLLFSIFFEFFRFHIFSCDTRVTTRLSVNLPNQDGFTLLLVDWLFMSGA